MKERKPIHELNLGTLRATIWDNGGDNADSQFSISVSRVCKENDTWIETQMLSPDDLPIAATALEMCYSWLWRRDILTYDDSRMNAPADVVARRSR